MDAGIGSLTSYSARTHRVPDVPSPAPAAPEAAARTETRLEAQRSVERDTATGSLVYRLVDAATGFVTVQTPSESRLKLRAYIDGITARNASEPAIEVTA